MPETVGDHIAYYTQKAGDLSRQLGLAGIAVIWLFKVSTASGPIIPQEFSLPLALIILSLALDLVQYFIGIVLWGKVWYRDPSANPTKSVADFKCQAVSMIVIVAVKVAIMLFAYIVLLISILGIVRFAKFP